MGSGNGLVLVDFEELSWESPSAIDGIASGVPVKVLRRGGALRIDTIVRLGPGPVAAPCGPGWAGMGMILSGSLVAGGIEYGRDTYWHQVPDADPGPLESPRGCTLYASLVGGRAVHSFDAFVSEDARAHGGLELVPFADLPWADGQPVVGLPAGVMVKVFRRNHDGERMDFLVRFPPGYTEPAHSHAGSGAGILLEGRFVFVDRRREYRPVQFTYDVPCVEHGPFHYPDGCMLFVTWSGGSAIHNYQAARGARR